jgi:hypothetical protein
MATTSKPWDATRDRFTDEQWETACLVEGLPVLEPDGDLNVHALEAASAELRRGSVPRDDRPLVARKLLRYYRAAGLEPPAAVTTLSRT